MKTFRFLLTLLLLFVFSVSTVLGAQQFLLKGKITDQKTKETIPYVNIYDSTSNIAITADSNGYFEVVLPEASYHFEFSSIGYQPIEKEITLTKDAILLVQMQQDVQLQEVTVTSEKLSKTAEQNASGITTLTSAAVERLPAFLGEKDIMKAILLTPGIQSGQEGARGIFVRGGSPDQNLILFHNAPVYNASHIYGFLSVFTMEALSKMDIYKSYIPVQYGGRLSSVINVTPNYGNTDNWNGDFSISVITSRFHIEGPLKKNRTSMNFTIRDCHAGFFTAPIFSKQLKKHGIDGTIKYFFYDINGAIRHKINDKNTLSWSIYTGSDFFEFADGQNNYRPTHFSSYTTHRKLNWINVANTIEWETKLKNSTINNSYVYSFYKLDSKQALDNIYRDYTTLLNTISHTQYNTFSKISEHGWQTLISQQIKKTHFFNYGIRFNGRTFTVNTLNATIKDSTNTILQQDHITNPKVNTFDFYAFADYKLNWKNKM